MRKGIATVDITWIIPLKTSAEMEENNTEPTPEKMKNKITARAAANINKALRFLDNQPENEPALIGKFPNSFAAVIPVIVAQVDPKSAVPIIIAGSELPEAALIAIALAGIKVIPAVLIARKVTIELVAVPFSGFKVSNSSIAFKPKGVAALPKPSILAEIFMIIDPIAG
jgi:hypothetical protein